MINVTGLIAFLLLVFLLMIIFLIYQFQVARAETQWTQQLETLANELGFAFSAKPNSFALSINTVTPFSRGNHYQVLNQMHGSIGHFEMLLFDYHYRVGNGGRGTSHHRLTIARFRLPPAQLPDFSLRPKTYWHKWGKWFGERNIKFLNDPVFSEGYGLFGPEIEVVRNLFTDDVRAFYKQHIGLCTEVIGEELFCFKRDYYGREQLLTPEEIYRLLDEGLAVYSLFMSKPQTPVYSSTNNIVTHRQKFY